jgi:PAS domain S-box-containing protein
VNGRRCAVSFNRDISERVTTRRQLEEDRARLQMAAKAGQIGFWDWDLTSNRVFYSDEWKAQLGHAPHEIGNEYMEWESRLHPDDRSRALAAVCDHLEGRRAGVDLEFRMRHKDGSWHWIHARGQCVAGGHGRPTRMVGCHIDVVGSGKSGVGRSGKSGVLHRVARFARKSSPGGSRLRALRECLRG